MIRLPEQRPAYAIPPGYGMHRLTVPELRERTGARALFDLLQLWQLPRRGHRYVIGADVADGIYKDRSVGDVFRLGTLEEPEEQVAQFISDRIPPRQFAYVLEALGRLYRWPDGREAMMAIENNNHGLSVQDTLLLHLGYRHFFIWEVLDQADPAKRFTTKLGWTTTTRTRPILLDQFYTGITTIDPLTGFSECRINSPFTLDEMRDFQSDGALWEAEAARGAHDDCIIAAAIAHYVCWRLMGGETEPLADRRRRRHAERVRAERIGQSLTARDFRNSDSTADEMHEMEGSGPPDPMELVEEEDFYGRDRAGTLY